MQLRDALHTLKMKTGESAAKHIIKFRLLLAQLASVGQTIAEAEAYTCLLRSLPIEYRSFVRSMRLQHTLTTQSVIASLLLEASHLQEEELNDKMAALYTDKRRGWTTSTPKMMHPKKSTEVDSSSRQKTPSKSSFPMQKMKCSYCKKQGHLAQECRKKKQDSAVEDRLEMLGWYRQLERNVGVFTYVLALIITHLGESFLGKSAFLSSRGYFDQKAHSIYKLTLRASVPERFSQKGKRSGLGKQIYRHWESEKEGHHVYYGEWANDKQNGVDKESKYEGLWKDGVPVCGTYSRNVRFDDDEDKLPLPMLEMANFQKLVGDLISDAWNAPPQSTL
ncbi:hypothetical protein AXG93_4368s1990 [Marchantia polymorpha subsp. ruderalis]|uniref:CCHC-type domain-containing protein n=1 Tax=Marchantia polymorpha subsp. ruderalis TaxID=1480154 RepID=A0A176VY55_MARPO|nr:hypothetical protein AXG93_4368s1990 [Marchantia polymorpha subsp. ruderalis]